MSGRRRTALVGIKTRLEFVFPKDWRIDVWEGVSGRFFAEVTRDGRGYSAHNLDPIAVADAIIDMRQNGHPPVSAHCIETLIAWNEKRDVFSNENI